MRSIFARRLCQIVKNEDTRILVTDGHKLNSIEWSGSLYRIDRKRGQLRPQEF